MEANFKTRQVLDYSYSVATYFPVSYDLNECTSHLLAVCKLSVTAGVLIKVKVKVNFSVTSHKDSYRGRNVWHTRLVLHLAQL